MFLDFVKLVINVNVEGGVFNYVGIGFVVCKIVVVVSF